MKISGKKSTYGAGQKWCYCLGLLIVFVWIFWVAFIWKSSLSMPTTITTANRTVPPITVENIQPSRPKSKFAYTTLISGIDQTMKYRGFLLNAVLMRIALRSFGSEADFIAMLGFASDSTDRSYFDADLQLLQSHGIIVHYLPRLLDQSIPLSFAEMALLKITPYSFTQYEKVQFFDGDVLPTKNMDCFFNLTTDTFTVGVVSPLNSGWFLAVTNIDHFNYFREKALWRLGRDWDTKAGWGLPMPESMTFRGGKSCTKWEFNGADMDQGLFTHRFILQGGGLLLDSELSLARLFLSNSPPKAALKLPLRKALKCCDGELPTSFFIHYTGRSKPWMPSNAKHMGKNTRYWLRLLDSLHLEVNSSNIYDKNLGSSLGFFNANFPKGGYPTNRQS